MAAERGDSRWVGLLLGLVAPILGFFAYGLIYTGWIRPHLDLDYYIHDLFLGTRRYQAPILSLSLIAEVPVFFLLDRLGWQHAMRGLITAMFLYGIAIVVLIV